MCSVTVAPYAVRNVSLLWMNWILFEWEIVRTTESDGKNTFRCVLCILFFFFRFRHYSAGVPRARIEIFPAWYSTASSLIRQSIQWQCWCHLLLGCCCCCYLLISSQSSEQFVPAAFIVVLIVSLGLDLLLQMQRYTETEVFASISFDSILLVQSTANIYKYSAVFESSIMTRRHAMRTTCMLIVICTLMKIIRDDRSTF